MVIVVCIWIVITAIQYILILIQSQCQCLGFDGYPSEAIQGRARMTYVLNFWFGLLRDMIVAGVTTYFCMTTNQKEKTRLLML